METLEIGLHRTDRFTVARAVDEKGEGGAYHEYAVDLKGSGDRVASVKFQNGPVKENGLNGLFMEDLMAIVIHRLQCFQSGPFSCRENALALTKMEEAMHWLNHRTKDRQRRGVEGTNKE